MASTRFTVLTGHLSQYSLADLIGILRHQRKTGRLLIEYMASPAILFFKDGDLVDAQYNTLVGVQAIFVAFVQPPAAFNFNPLMKPSRYSIDVEQQRVILELLGCWNEDTIVVKSAKAHSELSPHEMEPIETTRVEPQLLVGAPSVVRDPLLTEAKDVLALPAAPRDKSRTTRRRRPLVLAFAAFLLLLVFGVPTLIAINNKGRNAPAATNNIQSKSESATPATPVSDIEPAAGAHQAVGSELIGSPSDRKRERESTEQRNAVSEPAPAETRTDTPQTAVPSSTTQPTSLELKTNDAASTANAKQAASANQTVKVVMKIENGRVVQATVGERRPGSEAYESLALRIARQRRYPAGVNKQETLLMKVDGPK